MSNRVINFQLATRVGAAIAIAGGEMMICAAGTAHKVALVDAAGAALSNPVSFTNGRVYAEVAKSNDTVDLYIRSPTGHFRVIKGHRPGSAQTIHIETTETRTVYIIPFSILDATAATEKDSGFDLVTDAIVQPIGVGIEVTTLEAAKTVLFGTLSTESGGVAAGFGNALSLAALGFVGAVPTVTTGVLASTTLGAQLADYVVGTNADDRGISQPKVFRCNGTSKSISYTISTGATVAEGFIVFPVDLGGWVGQAAALN